MAEPSSALTFKDLIVRIARKAGMVYYGSAGANEALPPINRADLSFLKDIVNDAIRMFIADAPVGGWKWVERIMNVTMASVRTTGTADAADSTSITDLTLADTYDANDDLNDYWCYILTGTGAGSYAQITDYVGATGAITVADWLDEFGNAGGTDPVATDTFVVTDVETVGGDKARYPLAENFSGEVSGDITYAAGSSHSTFIKWTHESYIRKRRAVVVNTGYPLFAATRPLEYKSNALGPTRRFELFVDPQPQATDVLQFPYELVFDKLDCECGVGDSASTTTIVDATRDEADDYFNGWKITIIAGTGRGSYALVADYTGSTGTFTVADWLKSSGVAGGTDPSADSIYFVEPVNNKHPAGIRFDNVILAASMARAEQEIDEIVGGYIDAYVNKELPFAHKKDGRTGPRKLGNANTRQILRRDRTWSDVTTDNDV